MTYIYGLFNDREKILAANELTEEEASDWDFLWKEPLEEISSPIVATIRAHHIESDRGPKYGAIIVRKRLVSYGEWEDFSEE